MNLVAEIIKRFPHQVLLAVLEIFELRNRYIRNKARRLAQIPSLKQLDLSTTKKSDTVFILGSGSSISEISPERWVKIGDCDSYSFNFMVHHPFVPTHYFMEASVEIAFNQLLKFYSDREVEYRNVTKIILPAMPTKAKEEMQFQKLSALWKENLFAGGLHRTVTRTENELRAEISRLKKKGAFDLGRNHIYEVFKHMGSVTSLITVAVACSYKNIILCGIDITNPGYFYDDPSIYPEMAAYKNITRPKGEATIAARSAAQTPTKSVILEINRQVLIPAGINLYVENSSSALYPDIAVAPASMFD